VCWEVVAKRKELPVCCFFLGVLGFVSFDAGLQI
jgi:hypothetical protein